MQFIKGQKVKLISNQTDCWLPGDVAVVTDVPKHGNWVGISLNVNGARYAVEPHEIQQS